MIGKLSENIGKEVFNMLFPVYHLEADNPLIELSLDISRSAHSSVTGRSVLVQVAEHPFVPYIGKVKAVL